MRTLREIVRDVMEGGPSSGNFGHSGRPGERGGSMGKGASGSLLALRKPMTGGITVIGKGGKPWPKAKEISPKEINPKTARAFRELQAKLTTSAPLPKDQLRHWRKKYVGYAKGLKSMGRTPFGFKSYVKANRPQSEGRKAVESLKEIIHNVMEYGVQGMKWGQRKETDVIVGKPIKVFGRHATAIGAPTRSGLQARYNTMKGRMKQIKSWKQHHVTPTYAAAYATTPKAAGSTYTARSFAAIRATYQRGSQFHRTAKTIGQQMKNIKIWMRHAKD